MKRMHVFASLLVILALVLSACAQAKETEAPTEPAVVTEAPTEVETSFPPEGAPDEFKIGIVAFFSGGAAAPFGVPARNAAEAMIEEINAGQAPEPCGVEGIAGVPITAFYVDESGGAEQQVSEFRRLFLEENVDVVIGYVSSTDCLAVAQVADEIQGLTIAFDCGTARLFEDAEYDYIFRTNAHQTIDSIGAARYLLQIDPDAQNVASINQNYSWGQDSWKNFRDAMLQLKPDVEILTDQFPAFGATEFSAEISALQQANPQYIHSSLWGADLNGFIIQATPRGLFDESALILTVGEYATPSLREQIPEGTIIGSHGTHGTMAPENEYNDWLQDIYSSRYDMRPTYPAYHMSQALFGLKMAVENAVREMGQWPSDEEIIAAFEYLSFPSPSGEIEMAIGGGHQAVEDAAFGIAGEFDEQLGERTLNNVTVFPAACVNPPDGLTTQEWIDQGFPGAECPE